MIIYNVTTQMDWSIHEGWLAWMRAHHVPDMKGTGLVQEVVMARLLEVDEAEGPTYAVQYHMRSVSDYELYLERFAEEMRGRTAAKWGNQYISFRSIMEIVN